MSYLGAGYDSCAFEVNDTWVFRFPQRADVEAQLFTELRALPLLARSTPVPIPAFCWHGKPSSAFPRQFGGYAKLAGVAAIQVEPASLDVTRVAESLARFLSWLHSFPLADARQCGVPDVPPDALRPEITAAAREDFERVRQVAPPGAPLAEWQAYLERGVPPDAAALDPVLVHGDFAAEHVLVDPSTSAVTGVIDWTDVSIDDRALDLAGLFHWGSDRLLNEVLSRYSPAVDDATLTRARFMAACRGAGDVVFGLETHRPEYVRSGLRALERCAWR